MLTRRTFLEMALAAGAGAGLAPATRVFTGGAAAVKELEVHIFSKHLQFLDFDAMAEAAAEIGFHGVDLTVRPGGHVEPERVRDDLPRAVEAIRGSGLKADMMTTAIGDANDPSSRTVLETAADLGIRYYRMDWYRHPENTPLPESLESFRAQVRDLAAFNRELGIRGGYQNHAGNYVGASIWELWSLIRDVDPEWLGCQYDIRHAVVEGGLSWPQGLRLIRPYIHTVIAKDMRWTRNGDEWDVENVPIGDGMIDWSRYFGLLAQSEISVPLSLHLEYPIGGMGDGGGEGQVDQPAVFNAMRADLAAVQGYWRAAQPR